MVSITLCLRMNMVNMVMCVSASWKPARSYISLYYTLLTVYRAKFRFLIQCYFINLLKTLHIQHMVNVLSIHCLFPELSAELTNYIFSHFICCICYISESWWYPTLCLKKDSCHLLVYFMLPTYQCENGNTVSMCKWKIHIHRKHEDDKGQNQLSSS